MGRISCGFLPSFLMVGIESGGEFIKVNVMSITVPNQHFYIALQMLMKVHFQNRNFVVAGIYRI